MTRVGILSVTDAKKGLWRDMQGLVWALCMPPVRGGGAVPSSVTVFCAQITRAHPSSIYSEWASRPVVEGLDLPDTALLHTAPLGMSLLEFVDTVDVLVCFERLPVAAFDLAHREGKRCVYVPNLDWARFLDGTSEDWIQALVGRPWIDVWARQPSIGEHLASLGIASTFVHWSIPDLVRERRSCRASEVTLFLNAGNGGYRGRRATRAVIEAFIKARPRCPSLSLLVKTIGRASAHARGLLPAEGVEVMEGFIARDSLDELMERVDCVVHVSRWEGFGIPVLEALHAGLPVITHDGWPVGDLVEDLHNGLVVPAELEGEFTLTPIWDVDVDALADAMVQFAKDAALRDRLTCPAPYELISRQYAFRLHVRQRILGESVARALVIHSPLAGVPSRRSELYWVDALRSYGYAVTAVALDDGRALELADDVDFVLVGKPSLALLTRLRQRARFVALWHHDSPEYVQDWFTRARELADVCFVPYDPIAYDDDASSVMLHPGPRSTGSRGPGRRPPYAPAQRGDHAVFLGVVSPERHDLLRSAAAGAPLRHYGPGCPESLWDAQADDAYRSAGAVLAISRYKTSATKPHSYTSNRLFHAAALGAVVVAEDFPGLRDLYPEGVASFRGTDDVADVVHGAIVGHPSGGAKPAVAEHITWRRHSWRARMFQLLGVVSVLSAERPLRKPPPPPGPLPRSPASVRSTPSDPSSPATIVAPSWAEYWQQRATDYGYRAVCPVAWGAGRFDDETSRLWDLLRPVLADHVAGVTRCLDYGCGIGRFSTRLSKAFGLQVCGVDASQKMIEMALANGVDAQLLQEDGRLPHPDGYFDMLLSFTVLQHVPDDEIGAVIEEIRRTLRPGALVALFENTSPQFGRTSRAGHVVFRDPSEYERFFPGVQVIDFTDVDGERHHLFVGRLHE